MQQQPRPQVARALILGGVLLLVLSGLGQLLVSGNPLGWITLGFAAIAVAALVVLWRHGSFRRP